MQITDVVIKLCNEQHLLAYVSVVLDHCFVLKDLKIIEGRRLFVSFPSRKATDTCPQCRRPNQIKAAFCEHCGCQRDAERWQQASVLYYDECHPITPECRWMFEDAILAAYQEQISPELWEKCRQ